MKRTEGDIKSGATATGMLVLIAIPLLYPHAALSEPLAKTELKALPGELKAVPAIPDSPSSASPAAPLKGVVKLTESHMQEHLKAGVPTLDALHQNLKGELQTATPLKALKPKMDEKYEIMKAQAKVADQKKRRLRILQAYLNYGTAGMVLSGYPFEGWEVKEALPGGPAEAAGLRKYDSLLAVDGQSVANLTIKQIYERVVGHRGQVRQLTIERNHRRFTIPLQLWNINDFKNRRSQYISYYWYLRVHNFITKQQYDRLVKPFL